MARVLRITWSEAALRDLAHRSGGPVDRRVEDVARRIAKRARGTAPRITGQLSRAHYVSQRSASTWVVGANPKSKSGFPYAVAVHQGRKGFGAKKGKYLTFQVRPGGGNSRKRLATGRGSFVRVTHVGPAAGQQWLLQATEYVQAQVGPSVMTIRNVKPRDF